MFIQSKKSLLLILGITALLSSRGFFWLIDDPEGPNLLIVTVLAAVLFGVTLATVTVSPFSMLRQNLVGLITLQLLLVAVLYFLFG